MDKELIISIIAALDLTQGIGDKQTLPWHLPEDLAHFRALTTQSKPLAQNVVIMGRKTWESLPPNVRPLPQRINVVLSKSTLQLPEQVIQAQSLESALSQLQNLPNISQIFIIGGGSLYTQALTLTQIKTLYLTIIENIFDCDTFFPEYKSQFNRISTTTSRLSKTGIGFHFEEWRRK